MTYKEADAILAGVPPSDKPSKLNPSFTISQAVQVIRDATLAGIGEGKADRRVDYWLEKRVLQVSRNQRRPKMV